jgi:hypothetical protein
MTTSPLSQLPMLLLANSMFRSLLNHMRPR